MRDFIKLGVILMTYSLNADTSLAMVNMKSMPQILDNRFKAENEAKAEICPGMEGSFTLKEKVSDFPYWVGHQRWDMNDGGGYVFIARGAGYSSTIETMVGVKILSQRQTPGLGARIKDIRYGESEPWFTGQFRGKTVSGNIRVTKDGGYIDAVTGARISSHAVTDSINRGLIELHKRVGEVT